MYEFGILLHWSGFWGCHNLQIKIGGQGKTNYRNRRWGGMNEGMISKSNLNATTASQKNKSIGDILIQSVLSPTALATGREEGTRN